MEKSIINLNIGGAYTLKLAGLSSAGYMWEYKIEGPEIINIKTEMIGEIPKTAPGTPPPDTFDRDWLFTITALESGTAWLRIFLKRSWEHDKPPLKELCLKVIITK